MRNSRIAVASLFAALVLAGTLSGGAKSDIPPHGKAVVLFDGHDLANFDIFLKEHGLNNDPNQVFRVENGAIHVSGKEFGYVITKKEFADYYLRAEFKWGEGTYAPRDGQARDSGILYHVQGEQKVWPRSVEFQIIEGGTGDFWMTDGGAITGRDGRRGSILPRHPVVPAQTLNPHQLLLLRGFPAYLEAGGHGLVHQSFCLNGVQKGIFPGFSLSNANHVKNR